MISPLGINIVTPTMVKSSVRPCAHVYIVISEFFLSRYPFPLCSILPCIIFPSTSSNSVLFFVTATSLMYIRAFPSFLTLYSWATLSMTMRSDDHTNRCNAPVMCFELTCEALQPFKLCLHWICCWVPTTNSLPGSFFPFSPYGRDALFACVGFCRGRLCDTMCVSVRMRFGLQDRSFWKVWVGVVFSLELVIRLE